MIRSLLKRTKFHRAALPLLAMLLTTTTAWADVTPINVSYMKADGSTETHEAIPLDGSETTLSAGWYVVNSDITYDHNITISSAVTIILANGKTMNVGTSQQPLSSCYKAIGYSYASDNSALTIYGQSLDDSEAGHLNVYCANCANYYTDGISLQKSYTQHSGNVSVNAEAEAIRAATTFTVNGGTCKAITTGNPAAIYAHDANITGGTIVADGGMNSINASAGNVTISGGKITATNRFDTFGSIYATNVTLGWTNPDDYIKANSYEATNGITIADGKMLFDGTDFYSGTLTNEQKNTIADKTLRPAASVSYVKADGTSGTHEATILTGNENELGSYDGTTWYIVKNTQDGVDVAHTGKVTLYGNVNIILEDGAEATFEGNDQEALWSTFGNIYIYGQSGQTGKLTANGRIAIDAVDTSEGQANIGIYGGIITASGISGIAARGNITIAGGKVNATATGNDCEAIRTNKSVTISGGQVDATATGEQGIGIYSYSGNITITGGKVNATATGNDVAAILASTSVTISSGKLDANADGEKATAIYVDDFTLTGGQVIITATGTDATGIHANAGITLGWTNPSDFINANNYKVTNGIIIAEGKMLGNGTYFYSGTLTNEQKSAIAGKTLRPAGYCGAADANEGKNVTWSVADNGDDKLKLTISKNETEGQENYAMAEYTTESPAPWANVAAIINEVVVGDGVTYGVANVLAGCSNLTAATVPIATLQDCLANWSDKADVIKSTGSCGSSLNWSLTKNSGDKIGDNFPLKLTISGTGAMADFYFSDDRPWDDVRSNITEVAMSDGITTIGKAAFQDCIKLANISISNDVISIGDFAFKDCESLTEVTFPAKVNLIGDQAFAHCITLKTIHLQCSTPPTLVPSYGNYRFNFSGCTKLERILIPKVEDILNYAFADGWREFADKIGAEGYCGDENENGGKNLIWTVMPTGEKDQNKNLLYALNISVNPDVENQTNFGMMVTDYRNPSCDPWSGIRYLITELNIGEGVTKITPFAFCDLISLTSVIIPKSVEKIDEATFGDNSDKCPNLKWVYLKRNEPTAEKKITNLNYYEDKCNTFLGCPNLKYIIVDNMEAYKNATTADGWDDAMKAKLRSSKTMLFATGATNEWMTWCSDIAYTKPEGCTVYTVSNVTNDVVNLKLWEGNNLPAFVPVLIKREAGQLSTDIKAEFKDVPAAPENDNASTDGTDYTEIYIGYRYDSEGTIKTSFNANNHNNWGTIYANSGAVLNPNNTDWVENDDEASTYVLYGDKFLKVDTDEGIPTNHWILQIRFKESAYATRSLCIGYGDEDTTSIDEVRWQMADGEWYDLQGRRLDSKPTQKGLYINNGKKIVIK